jgi:CO/xanthine dehydrogenase Mo-binding subunit
MNQQSSGEFQHLGKPRKLAEGLEKVTGRVRYVGDVKLPGMLHGRVVLSPYAHATILSVDAAAARAIPGVVAVFTAADLPTRDRVITSRQSTALAHGTVRYRGEPVVLVVAENEAAAADGAAAVLVDYEPLPALASIEQALDPAAPAIWPHGAPKEEGEDLTAVHAATDADAAKSATPTAPNIHEQKRYERGNIAAGFAAADQIVEAVYRTPIVHQGYLEPHAVVADFEPVGRTLTVYTSTQGQFGVRNEVARLVGLPRGKVTVVPMTVGGGFGAKYGILDPLAAAASVALGKPVRVVLTRSEDFLTTTPSPATLIKIKLGARADGTITALDAEVNLDNGVYPFTLGGIVTMLLGGYYRFPNLRIDIREVLTNKPQTGAYRAPGAPQATFAIESAIDDLAARLGRDPLEFRLQNVAGPDDLTGEGDAWGGNIGLRAVLEQAQAHPLWRDRTPGSGVGIAVGGWPCGKTTAAAVCRVDTDGTVRVHIGSVDVSGSNTSFQLVAAEILGVAPEQVELVPGDTRSGPFAGPSGGSQITYSVAGAVADAAREARRQLLELASEHFEARMEDLEITNGQVGVRGLPGRTIALGKLAERAENKAGGPGPIVGEGRSAPPENAPGFVAHIVKVAVDAETGRVKPEQYVAIQDVGFAMNPLLVEGQIHGGAAQGVGWGIYEAMRYDENGELLTASLMDYCLPRADQVPQFETIMINNPSPHGPFGARGVGEPPITAGAAAIANAVRDAVGARVTELPINDEIVWRAMQQ